MRSIALLLASSFTLAHLGAQDTPAMPLGCGLTLHDGAVRAVGPDYAARFAADGTTFTAALGSRVASPASVHLRVAHVRRGSDHVFEGAQNVPPVADEHRVRFAHDRDLTEVYDVRPDGIEQSFEFARRPAGRGDLVVALRVTTDLVPGATDGDGIRFERLGAGGVAIGAVTGIDASGARAAGSLRLVDDLLELSLPAAFVDTAAYPLTLDPMIGSSVTLGNGTPGIDRQPSVAFDDATQRYLLVWNSELSTTNAEVWAQFVTVIGNPIGNPILVDANGRTGLRPAVANINDSDRFLLAWGRAAVQGTTSYTQARYAAMNASNGALSSSTHFAGNATITPIGLAIGGNSRQSILAVHDQALVVATLSSATAAWTTYSWSVLVPPTGGPLAGGSPTLLHSAGQLGRPAVSRNAGGSGRWLVAVAVGSTFSDVVGSFVAIDGSLCHQTTLAPFAGAAQTAVATRNGVEFLVAYDNLAGSGIRTLRCSFTGSCATGATTIASALDPIQAPGLHWQPELECAGDKYVLSWETAAAQNLPRDIRVRGLSLVDGTAAGAIHYAGGSATPLLGETGSALASRWSAGDTASDEALLVWSSGVIVGRRYEATGTGTVQSLGGACGFSGLTDYATYSGTPALGTTFTIELLAPTAPVLALIAGFSQSPIACGPCTIVPAADIVLSGPGPVAVTVPLDVNLIGFELYAQWVQWRATACPLLPLLGFSNTLKFTVAE